MTAGTESDDGQPLDDNAWAIDGMAPIAVAHAEAAAKAAGVGVGEWLSQLLADRMSQARPSPEHDGPPSAPSDGGRDEALGP